MDCKLFGIFSGRQRTAIAITAIVAPTALYGAVATTAVSITDPNTGQKSFVDAARRLNVYDATAGFRNNPSNFVRIQLGCSAATYTPPSGKALILTSANLAYALRTQGSENYVQVLNQSTEIVIDLESINSADSTNSDFGSGFYVKNGETLSSLCRGGEQGVATLAGYLVPSTAVPPSVAEASTTRIPRMHSR